MNNLQREGVYGPAVVQGGGLPDSRVGSLPPSQVRLQQYTASLRVRVRDLDHLSSATKQAMRATRRLGGYVASVDFGTPGGKAGEAYLLLRIPVGRVQQAVMSFSNLGTILSQQVSILDVQGQVNEQIRQISILRTQIAIVERTLRDQSLSAEARARLQVQLVGQKQRLAGLLRQKAATTKRARLAQVSLALTTHKTAAATKPHHRGRLGRALDDAGSILAREAAIALYALIIVGPFLLLAAAGVAGGRLLRRRGEQRLLERTS